MSCLLTCRDFLIKRTFKAKVKIVTKLVKGVGINDGKYLTKVNGKHVKEYELWCDLLKRCYSSLPRKRNLTYVGCQASRNFKKYSYFHEWCQAQIGFNQKGFHLDKDLLFKNNKLYSEDTCLFVPRELNTLLISSRASRGSLPVGVSDHKDRFQARCCTGKTSNFIGHFNTPDEAFQAYKQVKEAYIKLQAEKWKDFIDPRAYTALMTYEVQITD